MRRLERRTPVLNLVREWPKFLIKKGRGIAFGVGTHIAVVAMGIIAVGNRGNRQLALAWDDSLVTPLGLLDRPENVGTRSSVLRFCTCCV